MGGGGQTKTKGFTLHRGHAEDEGHFSGLVRPSCSGVFVLNVLPGRASPLRPVLCLLGGGPLLGASVSQRGPSGCGGSCSAFHAR